MASPRLLRWDLARPTRIVFGLLQIWLGMTVAERAARSKLPVFRQMKMSVE